MLNRLRKIPRNDRGVSAIEFALLAPILSTLFIGCIEVTFMIWSTQKAEKLAVTMADVIAQSQNVSKADIDALTGSVDKIMDPFPFGEDGAVFISSVYRAQGDAVAKVNWQCPHIGNLEVASKVGEKGDDAVLPSGFTLAERDNVIVAEVFYKYKPLAPGVLFDDQVIYRRALFKPRLGALTNPPTGC